MDSHFDRIADRAQARGEGLYLGASDICLHEVLSDKESAGDAARVAQNDLRCAGANTNSATQEPSPPHPQM